MNATGKRQAKKLKELIERAKELDCLYKIDELISDSDISIDEFFKGVISVIPFAWTFPRDCQVKIAYEERSYCSDEYANQGENQTSDIRVEDRVVGYIEVSYREALVSSKKRVFLKEEQKLLDAITARIGVKIENSEIQKNLTKNHEHDAWRILVRHLEHTDWLLFRRITQKMLYHLCWNGVNKANSLLEEASSGTIDNNFGKEDSNMPLKKEPLDSIAEESEAIFEIAKYTFSGDQIVSLIENWILHDKTRDVIKAIDNPNSSIKEIVQAVNRFHEIKNKGEVLSLSGKKGIQVSLVRRFFSNLLDYINISKEFIEISDFFHLVKNVIYLPESRGKLGGKSAGLFLAEKILKKANSANHLFDNLKVPKTWYITSDGLINFIYNNNIEEIVEQKYKDIEEISLEYSNIVQIFKNSRFSEEIIKGALIAIEDFGDRPIIVRSSSLLEDSLGAAFSGKYKSLFLANQGTKKERLDALLDAIAEVYASMFAPDPIGYRIERELLDYPEEMGIMIQEVVGSRVGDYFFPVCAGVAFSNNEFRWSPRIKREDGLIRLVPGLGTRAVDRVSEDFPVLIAPQNLQLKVNVSPSEIVKYAPKKIDVINLKNNRFETVELEEVLREHGDQIPAIQQVISLYNNDFITSPSSLLNIDFERDNMVVTFDGLLNRTPFVNQIKEMLEILQDTLETPVDIEFAYDGTDFYLLQCRPQSSVGEFAPDTIPENIDEEKILFTANEYISNGTVPEITHIVYIDPQNYGKIEDLSTLRSVGRIVGKLNRLLPKRQFILMGPGRWGSRGDIKLGVDVTYSDINNTAMLIEISMKRGDYTPDLSFGTHFFQDLVEAGIRYLPLYPERDDVLFDHGFFNNSDSILEDLIPEAHNLKDVIHVIDVKKKGEKEVMKILLNADTNRAVAYIDSSRRDVETKESVSSKSYSADDHWKWRSHMAEQIASNLDATRFGVKGLYLFGSTKNGIANAGSDINLMVHFIGNEMQREKLLYWFEGYSTALASINYLKTGEKLDGLLDIHLVSDDDVKGGVGLAKKIGAVTNPARKLSLKS